MAAKWKKDFEDKILNSPAVRRDVGARASRVAKAAGDGFQADLKGWTRPYPGGVVAAVSFSARVRNSRENILIRALEAGRG